MGVGLGASVVSAFRGSTKVEAVSCPRLAVGVGVQLQGESVRVMSARMGPSRGSVTAAVVLESLSVRGPSLR